MALVPRLERTTADLTVTESIETVHLARRAELARLSSTVREGIQVGGWQGGRGRGRVSSNPHNLTSVPVAGVLQPVWGHVVAFGADEVR